MWRKSWRVYLATDVDTVADAFRLAFGDRLIIQPSVMRSSNEHQFHEVATNGDIRWAEQVLIDALALSRTDAFLHIVSNVAIAAGYINPSVRMVYCVPVRFLLAHRLNLLQEGLAKTYRSIEATLTAWQERVRSTISTVRLHLSRTVLGTVYRACKAWIIRPPRR
jgi:hypothetical protein